MKHHTMQQHLTTLTRAVLVDVTQVHLCTQRSLAGIQLPTDPLLGVESDVLINLSNLHFITHQQAHEGLLISVYFMSSNLASEILKCTSTKVI